MVVSNRDLAYHVAELSAALRMAAATRAKKNPTPVDLCKIGLSLPREMHPSLAALNALLFLSEIAHDNPDKDSSRERRHQLDKALCVFIRNGIDDFDAPWVIRHAQGIADALGHPYTSVEDIRASALRASPFPIEMDNSKKTAVSRAISSETIWSKLLFIGLGTMIILGVQYAILSGMFTEESLRSPYFNNGVIKVTYYFFSYGMKPILVLSWIACLLGIVGLVLARRKAKAS